MDTSRLSRIALPLGTAAVLCAACGSSGSSGGAAPAAAVATSIPPSPSATASPSASPIASLKGYDDVNGDGQPDPTCGTQDFGAGLVLRIPCTIDSAHEPESGTTLVPKSLYRLPNPGDIHLDGVSGEVIGGRDPHGGKVEIVVYNSDELFATGSATISSTDTMNNTIKDVNAQWPGSAMQVRGHTDDTGSPAGNQTLSEQRAQTVRQYLLAHGIKASTVTAVGLGATHPLVQNTTPQGQAFNRRVELVIRVPNA